MKQRTEVDELREKMDEKEEHACEEEREEGTTAAGAEDDVEGGDWGVVVFVGFFTYRERRENE